MKQYSVVFTPEAQEQLAALYIAATASPEIAERYTNAIVTHCEGLQTFPHRGTRREDIRPADTLEEFQFVATHETSLFYSEIFSVVRTARSSRSENQHHQNHNIM